MNEGFKVLISSLTPQLSAAALPANDSSYMNCCFARSSQKHLSVGLHQ
jgi:hypothetical protein